MQAQHLSVKLTLIGLLAIAPAALFGIDTNTAKQPGGASSREPY